MVTVSSRLIAYAARRLAFALVLVLLVSSSALVLAGLAPGDVTSGLIVAGVRPDVIARERARLGLDRPLAEQYTTWLGRAARLDLGTSLLYQRPVTELLGERIGNTALLAATSLGLAALVGLPLGVVTGSRRGWLPAAVGTMSIVAISVPPLILSLLLALMAARTGWFPVGGLGPPDASAGVLASLWSTAWYLTLPALALALPFAAIIERLQSEATAAALGAPHILAARARGVSETRLVWRHALRPSLRPVAAISGIIIGTLFSGSFAVEIVTAWPGLGRLMYEALMSRDIYLVAGCAAAGALVLAVGTLASDALLALLDPRLRQETT